MTLFGFVIDLRLVLAAICVAGAVYWAAEAASLFARYRCLAADVLDRTYTDAQQVADRKAHPWDRMMNLSPHSIRATVRDNVRVRYVVDGRDYETVLEKGRLRGVPAGRTEPVWYDPEDPARLLKNGPVGALWCSLGALLVAGVILDLI